MFVEATKSEIRLRDMGWLASVSVALGSVFLVLIASRLDQPGWVFSLPVVAAAGWAFLTHRSWALSVLVFATYADLPRVLSKVHGLPSPNVALLLLVLVAICVGWLRSQERPLPRADVAWPIGLYLGSCLLSIVGAEFQEASLDRLADYSKALLIGLTASLALDRREDLAKVAGAVVAATLVISSVTTVQFLTETFQTSFLGFGQVEVHWLLGKEQFRSSGPTADPNFYGLILVGGIPLALAMLLSARNRLTTVINLACLGTALSSLLFTYSRGALVGLAAALLFLAIRWRPPLKLVVGAALICVFAVPVLAPSYGARILAIPTTVSQVFHGDSGAESSTRGRIAEGLVALQMFRRHPIRGVGIGNYPPLYQDYQVDLGLDSRISEREPHSLYLETAAETGIVGLLCLAIVLLRIAGGLSSGTLRLDRAGYSRDADLIWGFGASLVGVLTSSMLLHAAKPNHLWLLLAFGLAISSLSARSPDHQHDPKDATTS